jgi:hypothetical protein
MHYIHSQARRHLVLHVVTISARHLEISGRTALFIIRQEDRLVTKFLCTPAIMTAA